MAGSRNVGEEGNTGRGGAGGRAAEQREGTEGVGNERVRVSGLGVPGVTEEMSRARGGDTVRTRETWSVSDDHGSAAGNNRDRR